MYKRPLPKPRVSGDKPLARAESSPFWSLCQPILIPRHVPTSRGPILQIENLIFGLRRQGVPEDHLERLREENKYIPPPPVPVRRTKKKKVLIEPVFVPVSVPKKKVLKAVVKKI